MNWKLPHPALAELLSAFSQTNIPVYIVGGAVRDLLLQRQAALTDVDLVVDGSAIPVARHVADQLGWAYYPLDETRDVARLILTPTGASSLVCDVAAMRGGTIDADLYLRDFTVNAMAYAITTASASPTIIDPVGGQLDLSNNMIRRVSATSMEEDPVRLLRAVRLANQFGFALEAETKAQLCQLSHTIQSVSPERIRDELWKLMSTARPHHSINMLREVGLLAYLLPEVAATIGVEQSLPHLYPVYEHTLNTVENAVALRDWMMGQTARPYNAAHAQVQHELGAWQQRLHDHLDTVIGSNRRRADWLIWFALLHDIGKPQTLTIEQLKEGRTRTRFFEHESIGAELVDQRLTALRFNRNEIELAHAVVRGHMRPHHLHMSFTGQAISRRALFRFFRDVGGKQTGIGPGLDVLLVALADRLSVTQDIPPDPAGYIGHIDQLLKYAFEEAPQLPLPLVDGHVLMKRLALAPGPQLGNLMEYLLEAQAAGEVTTADEALALATSWLEQDGA